MLLSTPPRGVFQSRVDEKGRLRLPAEICYFLSRTSEEGLFITTLDFRVARIYPLSMWHENMRILAEEASEPRMAQDLLFVANSFGGESAIDSQGRVLLPLHLRRRLKMENCAAMLKVLRGVVHVYGEESLLSSEKERREIIDPLTRHGLK